MIKEERQKLIMREINLHNKVLSNDLSILLDVSEDTVRRDLKELVEEGYIIKVHGGAISKSLATPFMKDSTVYAQDYKQTIAEKTLSLIKKDMVILTEGGTTMLEVAKAIPEHLTVTFFTISPQVAITLSEKSNLEVITIGGKLCKNANLHTGSSVINQLSEIKADLCLLGANGFSAEEGLTDVDWEIVQVKKAIVRSARKTAVLCISEKLNSSRRLKICDVNQVDYLVTELAPNHPMMAAYNKEGLTVL
ncbi:DeoR/GlpR family DNA-binding transcription regulator [Chitinophaga sp. GCM10012297]|uniref:DeoR/GlpR transcriptional regulator n=1 Tax=Chitinophaga chungangae TaxID=2821488 RepID=A0ABS3YG14_9BACT|nr:DeoR/GlpR family DNA-binding transcription regulator [Chitinophaga chungangae]MBO9153606.1 DeoR/GlpR transcriptional regulator [Chitinophaga chungangae]